MAHKTATIYINVKTDDGKWKFFRPALKENRRMHPRRLGLWCTGPGGMRPHLLLVRGDLRIR